MKIAIGLGLTQRSGAVSEGGGGGDELPDSLFALDFTTGTYSPGALSTMLDKNELVVSNAYRVDPGTDDPDHYLVSEFQGPLLSYLTTDSFSVVIDVELAYSEDGDVITRGGLFWLVGTDGNQELAVDLRGQDEESFSIDAYFFSETGNSDSFNFESDFALGRHLVGFSFDRDTQTITLSIDGDLGVTQSVAYSYPGVPDPFTFYLGCLGGENYESVQEGWGTWTRPLVIREAIVYPLLSEEDLILASTPQSFTPPVLYPDLAVTVLTPANDSSVNLTQDVLFSTGPFVDNGAGNTHVSTDWYVVDDTFNVVWSSFADTTHKTSITIPGGTIASPVTDKPGWGFYAIFHGSLDTSPPGNTTVTALGA